MTEPNAAVVTFRKSIISSVDDIAVTSNQLTDFIREHQPKKLIFDFQGVKFFSSQVLGLLLEMRAKLRDHGGEVIISSINPQLHRVFKITNLDQVFRFYPDRQTAVAAAQTG